MEKRKWTPEEVTQWQNAHPGSFYKNEEDKNLFVKKRGSAAWTLNLANPLAWVLIAGLNALVALAFVVL